MVLQVGHFTRISFNYNLTIMGGMGLPKQLATARVNSALPAEIRLSTVKQLTIALRIRGLIIG